MAEAPTQRPDRFSMDKAQKRKETFASRVE